uniref:Uncharacterized protein n=1 Tax=Panagrolaimus sp. ES5 TaxID=591445 RepID=A0AC34GF98_9BILA
MKNEPEYNLESFVERSNIYKEDGFIVNAFAVNQEIGKVAVLRRHDKKNATETKGLCKIEFYSTIDMPKMFFEKSVVIQETLVEGIAWIGDTILACVCLDGSRHQISATPFWCVAPFTGNEVVAGTDSGNVFLLKYIENQENKIVAGTDSGNVFLLKYVENQENKSGDIIVVKQFSVGTDQRSLAITASGKLGIIAVGCLDKVYIINAIDGKSLSIQMQREHRRATIAWSLLF